MKFMPIALLLLLPLALRAAEPMPHAAFAPMEGVQVIDAGTFAVTGGPFDRTETFELLRLADGRHALFNTITGADGSYRVQGAWTYDAEWQAIDARGLALYDGAPVEVRITKDAPKATITTTQGGETSGEEGPCPADCFLNLAPSTLAMFVMTRHYDLEAGGEQDFTWASRALNRDASMFGGISRLTLIRAEDVMRPTGPMVLRHYVMRETLPDGQGGSFDVAFNLWTDDAHRPIKFKTGAPGSGFEAWGLRSGFEDLDDQMVPIE